MKPQDRGHPKLRLRVNDQYFGPAARWLYVWFYGKPQRRYRARLRLSRYLIGRALGVVMRVTGTISDFDSTGGFGLIVADDGELLPFSVAAAPPALRGRFGVGTRVAFRMGSSQPSARAVEVVPIEEAIQRGASDGSSLAH